MEKDRKNPTVKSALQRMLDKKNELLANASKNNNLTK